jgi:hypothetical protein
MADSFVVLENHLPEILRQLHKAASDIVAETAQEIADTYANTAAIDTGFMRSSAYMRTVERSTYAQDLVGAGPLLPEVPKPEQDQTAIAAVAAEYAGWVEHGTRRMAAQPAFYPAVDKARASFGHKLSELERRIKVKGGSE